MTIYVSIHTNLNLSGVQKFTYLKAQLEGDGLSFTETTYSVALLEDRYAQTHKLIKAHMKAFLEMPSLTNSFASLHVFYDSVGCHIRELS